jgi:hypothetical protein
VGRHRPDPRGHARILIAVLAVVLALVLLIVGGVALFGALNSDAAPTGTTQATPTASNSVAVSRSKVSSSGQGRTAGARHALVLTVTGPPTKVYVTVSGNQSQVLEDSVLNTGDVRQYDETPLDVVVSDGGAVEVSIYGRPQPRLKSGQRGEWHVNPR